MKTPLPCVGPIARLIKAAGLALTAALGLSAISAGYSPVQAGIHQGVPPSKLWASGDFSAKWSTPNDMHGSMTYDCRNSKLELTWRYNYLYIEQEIVLPYYPTSAGVVKRAPGKTILCVGGKLPTGETVMELITLRDPQLMLVFPSGYASLNAGTISNRRYIYNEATVGRDMVRFLRAVRHDENKVLVRFEDSGDLYTVHINTRVKEIQASSTNGIGGLFVPEISGPYGGLWSGIHLSMGDVYVLVQHTAMATDPIVFIDEDADGTFDDFIIPTDAEWTAMGLSDAESYEDW